MRLLEAFEFLRTGNPGQKCDSTVPEIDQVAGDRKSPGLDIDINVILRFALHIPAAEDDGGLPALLECLDHSLRRMSIPDQNRPIDAPGTDREDVRAGGVEQI